MENASIFNYTYSAPQNQEIQAIRRKYLPREESKLEELRRLDQDVQNAGITESLIVGILGCMVFGLGLCMAMKIIGSSMALGVVTGLIGVALMLPAYPIYRSVSGKVKAKLTPRILQLADELSGEE